MLIKIIKIVGIIIFVFVLSLTIIFFFVLERVEPIKRPSNVPLDAIYDGGPDGGNWIWCVPYKDSTNIFYCEVYDDDSGITVYKGLFKFDGKKISLDELRKLLGIYTGDTILLKDYKELKTVIPLDSSTYESIMERTLENPF